MLITFILVALLAGGADDRAAQCAGIADHARRLACYDAAYRDPDAPQGAADAKPPSAGPDMLGKAPEVAKVMESEFGLSGQQKEKHRGGGAKGDRIRSLIVAVEPDRHGKPRFRLENGQRWTQTEATDWPAFEVGETLEIRRATLGSFLASVPGSGRPAVRVRRLE